MSELRGGERIADRYVIVEPLGSGGMGVVYRARDDKLGRHVALKVLPVDRAFDARARERLVREARAAANLDHPGIVRVYDVGETSTGDAFLVMELVRGETLRDRMRRIERLPHEDVLRIVREVGQTLTAAHRAGLVHRDVKPDNIMVREDGRVVLLDFGLVKTLGPAHSDTQTPDTPQVEPLTQDGAIMGTPAYLAPEQARGTSAPATDQWALAVVAFELLTGKVPWRTENPTQLLAQILIDAPPSISSASDLPAVLDAVFARALSKEPSQRFDSAAAFGDALEQALLHGEKPESNSRPTMLVPGTGAHRARPLSAPNSVLACPVLEGVGGDDARWIGAAASAIVAERAMWVLGGDADRVVPPAELLGLPTQPIESFPSDALDAPTARPQSLAAARDLGDAWVDGTVRCRGDRFDVRLRLLQDDMEIASGRGRDRALYAAVRRAMEPLIAEGALPKAEMVAESAQQWLDIEDVDAAVALCDFWLAHGEARSGEPARALVFGDALGVSRVFVEAAQSDAPADLPPVALDRGDNRSLVQTAIARYGAIEGLNRPPVPQPSVAEARALATELRAVVRTATSLQLRSRAASAEAATLAIGDDLEAARTAAVRSVQLDHRSRLGWLYRAATSELGATQHVVFTAGSAWFPWDSYQLMSQGRTTANMERRLQMVRRAHALLPDSPAYISTLGAALLEMGAREETRSLAIAHVDGDLEQKLVAETLLAQVDAAEARFGRAYDRVVQTLGALPQLGSPTGADSHLAFLLRELGELLGRSIESSDLFLELFLEPDPPRLGSLMHSYGPALAAVHCALATPERGERGIQKLAGLGDVYVRELVEGVTAYLRGDWETAASCWRSYAVSPNLWSMRFAIVLAPAFERAGQPELAARVDEWMLNNAGAFNGANLADVRAARRAEAKHDTVTARHHARVVIDAWAASDPPVAVVDEMRALLERLPA